VDTRIGEERSKLLGKLAARREDLRLAAAVPSPADDAIGRIVDYAHEYPRATLAAAVCGGALLGRLARRGGMPLLISLAIPLARRYVLPRLLGGILGPEKTDRRSR
jgi:hypothetical protein